jgi:hypothetical protein
VSHAGGSPGVPGRGILPSVSVAEPQVLVPDPVVEAYKRGVDRTLLRENLRRTPEQRLLRLMELQGFAAELRRAGEKARAGQP